MSNKVLENSAWIIGCKIIQSILALIITMLTARYLGPSNFGLINYAASVVAFVVPIMQLGLPNVLVREVVNYPDDEGKILGTSLSLSLLSGTACIIGVITFALIVNNKEPLTILVCALYSIILLAQAIEMIQYWFQAKMLSKYVSLVSLGAYIIISVYKLFLVFMEKSIIWFAISYSLDYFIIAISIFLIYKKKDGQRLVFSKTIAKRMLDSSKYYILSSMMVTIFAQTDRIMLKMMIDDAATGYYSAAVACASMTSFVFTAIIDSARPSIFKNKITNQKYFELNMSRLYSIIIYFALAQSVIITIFSHLIIHVLYGDSYLMSVSALRIVVWYTTFSYIGSVRNIWILAENKQKWLWLINLFGATTNIVLNAVLIPKMSVNGAAIASLFTQFFTNVIIGFIIKDIRYNNKLMLRGLNPRLTIDMAINMIKLGKK